MKKLAMLLALALCLMIAATAMADFAIPATATGFGYSTTYDDTYFKNKHQLRFLDSNRDFREDFKADYPTMPVPDMTEAELVDLLENAMLLEISQAFNGKEFNYMFYDVEAQTLNFRDEWNAMNVPRSKDGNDVGAESVAGVIPQERFGGAVDQVAAVYAAFDDYNSVREQYLRIENVKSVQVVDGGVEMTFDHLSPVMIAWTNKPIAAPLQPPVEGLPQTGDSSSLLGLFILLGMSVAAFGAMKLRREN